MTLAQLTVGDSCTVISIGGQGAIRRRLLDLGITPNTIVKVVKIAPLGDPILISLRGFQLTLRKDEAKYIVVERMAN